MKAGEFHHFHRLYCMKFLFFSNLGNRPYSSVYSLPLVSALPLGGSPRILALSSADYSSLSPPRTIRHGHKLIGDTPQ